MEKKIIICISLTFLILGCSLHKSKEIITIYMHHWDYNDNEFPKIISYTPLDVYEAKENMFCLLDSIIEETKKCQKYNISLEFDIYVSHFLGDTIFSIDNCNSDYTNLPFYDGFFLYKNIPFYYIGIFLPDFFEKTGQMTFRRYGKTLDIKMKNVKYVYDNEIYEKELSWDYIFKDGKLILVGYSDCEWK